jgi:hypothetical protein
MKSEKIYLLHDFKQDIDYTDGHIIALYPDVAYELDKRKISYSLLHDYYSENDIFKHQDKKFFSLLEQVKNMDAVIRKLLEQNLKFKTGLFSLNVSDFKYLVEELFIELEVVKSLLENYGKIKEIVYISKPLTSIKSIGCRQFLRKEKNNFLFELLEHFTNHRDISLKTIELDVAPVMADKKSLSVKVKDFFKHHFRSKFEFLKKIQYSSKYITDCIKENGRAIFFLNSGSFQIDFVINDYIKNGYSIHINDKENVRFLEKKGALKLSLIEQQLHPFGFKKEQFVDLSQIILTSKDYNEWKDEYFKTFEVKYILDSFISELITNTIYQQLQWVEGYRSYFIKHNITRIIATNSAGEHTKAALLAAESLNIPKVCYQHGIHAYYDRLIVLTDLLPFDEFYATDHFSKEMYKEKVGMQDITECNVSVATHYLENFSQQAVKNKKMIKKKTYLYVPTKVVGFRRSLTVPTYPVHWYYEYQKALVDFFIAQKDIKFIFKQPKSDWDIAAKSIIPYIKKQNPDNVVIETDRLSKYFDHVSGVIVDRPTTSTFESIAYGLPTLCLCGSSVSIGLFEQFKVFLKSSLFIFPSIDDAIFKIQSFISEPDSFTVTSKKELFGNSSQQAQKKKESLSS